MYQISQDVLCCALNHPLENNMLMKSIQESKTCRGAGQRLYTFPKPILCIKVCKFINICNAINRMMSLTIKFLSISIHNVIPSTLNHHKYGFTTFRTKEFP